MDKFFKKIILPLFAFGIVVSIFMSFVLAATVVTLAAVKVLGI